MPEITARRRPPSHAPSPCLQSDPAQVGTNGSWENNERRSRARRRLVRSYKREWAGLYAGFCLGDGSPWTAISLGDTLPCRSSNLPGNSAGSLRVPCWSCSGRGLPSEPCHHGPWWSLTPPFHPYRHECRRSAFCCTFSRISPGGRYPPPCPAEPGRSSARSRATRPSGRPIRKDRVYARPDSAVRTMMHPHSGQCMTSSSAAPRSSAMSVGASAMWHPPQVPC